MRWSIREAEKEMRHLQEVKPKCLKKYTLNVLKKITLINK